MARCLSMVSARSLAQGLSGSDLHATERQTAGANGVRPGPSHVKRIIDTKGLPIGKGVSIAPGDIDFDLKAMKLKGLSFDITWKF